MARLEETRPTGQTRARGLLSDRASGARIEARTFTPPAEVHDVVESMWIGRWDLPADQPHITQLLGDPCLHLVWERGVGPPPHERLVGVWTRLWTRRLEGRGSVYGLKLRAGAAAAIVDDASAFTNTIVPLSQVATVPPVLLQDEDHPADDEAVFRMLTDWFVRVRRAHPDTSLAVQAVQRARSERGLTRVEQLVNEVGLSERSLQRLFRLHVGASPKQVLRRMRLQEAAARLDQGGSVSLTELAFELGYADQAHFSRDWRAAVRTSPSGYQRAQASGPGKPRPDGSGSR